METPRSSHAETKLLVTLLSGVATKPKNVAQTAQISPQPAVRSQTPSTTLRAKQSAINAPTPKRTIVPEPVVGAAASHTHEADLSQFDWQAILAYAQRHYTALYAILSKCTPEVRADKVVLYAGRKFNKTKLDSAKYRPLLGQILSETGVGEGAVVEILDTTAPPKDEQAAKIAAMMGGGEEVDVS